MKVTLNGVGNLIDATTAKNTINNNSQIIEDAFDNTLSLDGTAPNQMQSELDMDSHQVLNLPQPATADSPLRLQDLSTFVGGGTVTNMPSGGTSGQILAKNSSTNYDVHWISEASDLTAGTNIAITGTSPATISTTANPNFATSVTTPTLVLGATSLTSVTGTGSVVASTSPTLSAPALVNPSFSGTITLPGGITTNATTGTVNLVLSTSPTITSPILVTPALGTPTSGVATNLTGTASGLTAGNATLAATVTTNANLTGAVTSVGNAASLGSFTSSALKTALTDETGSGAAVFATSPALVTPTGIVKGDVGLGNVDNTSDATKNAAAVTLTNKTITAPVISTITNTGTLTLPTSTDTLVGKATTDTFTNKTFNTAGTGNTFQINGTTVNAITGTGSAVLATSPTFTTSLTSPLVVGGTAVSSTLSLQSTSGVGSSDAIKFLVGNNGGTEAVRILTNGNVGINNINPQNSLAVGGAGGTNAGFEVQVGTSISLVTYNRNTSAYATCTFDVSAVQFRVNGSSSNGLYMAGSSGVSIGLNNDPGVGNLLLNGILKYNGAPTAVAGAGPFLVGSGSTLNNRMKVNLNGTDYWVPCSTTAF